FSASCVLALVSWSAMLPAVVRSPALRYALACAVSLATWASPSLTWRLTRSTSARYCSRPCRPSLSCSTARSYSYCIWAIGSASQKKLASLLSCARIAPKNLPKIMRVASAPEAPSGPGSLKVATSPTSLNPTCSLPGGRQEEIGHEMRVRSRHGHRTARAREARRRRYVEARPLHHAVPHVPVELRDRRGRADRHVDLAVPA